MSKSIWYISKYAVSPEFGNPTRQFIFSKYFNKQDFHTTLISSLACGINFSNNIVFDNYYKFSSAKEVNHYLLKGTKVSLGFSFTRIISWFQFEWFVFRLGNKIGMNQKPDIIIVSSLSLLTIFNGIYFKWKFGSKFVLEIRDIWPQTLIEVGGYSVFNPIILFLRFVELLGYKYADKIIGLMPNLKDHVPAKYKDKVNYIPHGIDLSIYRQNEFSDTSKRILSKVDPSKFNVVYSGSIGKVNDVEKMIELLNECHKKNYKIIFHIIGDGTKKSNLISKYQNYKNLIFHNYVPKSELPYLLSNFRANIIHISPLNIYRFGISPNKLNEYLISGNPTILIYDGYKSVIEEADAGFVISSLRFENIVSEILKISNMDELILNQKGDNGREYAQKYLDYNFLVKKYLKIISQDI